MATRVTFEFDDADYEYLKQVAKDDKIDLGQIIGNSLSIQKALRSTEEGEALVYDREKGVTTIRKFR